MRRRRAAIACAALSFALVGWRTAAAWTAVGAGAASAGASRIPVAPAPTASPTTGGATVAWGPVVGAASYRVRRFDGSGSPASPAGTCGSTVASTTCLDSPAPAGSWTYAVRGIVASWTGSEGPTGAAVVVTAPDSTPPTVTVAAVARVGGGTAGSIRPGATYNVYADASDAGSGATGIAEVRADASALTAGSTAVALAAGTWTVEGTTYTWRSASLVASSSLTNGATFAVPVTATDRAGNAASRNAQVTIDSTAPTAADVQTANGGTTGRADAGDRIVLTYSEALDPTSVSSGWTGSAPLAAVVRFADGGTGSDSVTVWNATNTAQLPLGSITLGANDYVNGAATFGASGTSSTVAISGATLTITLGTSNNSTRVLAGSTTSTMTWTPSNVATDRAGNPCTTAARTESGTADREF